MLLYEMHFFFDQRPTEHSFTVNSFKIPISSVSYCQVPADLLKMVHEMTDSQLKMELEKRCDHYKNVLSVYVF